MTNYPYRFSDPIPLAIAYLNEQGFTAVAEEPDFEDYENTATLVLVKDGGGPGVYVHEINRALITFEVRSLDRETAAETASKVEAIVRDWENREDFVYYKGSLGRPVFYPDEERRIPAYQWTVEFWFRGDPLNF